MLAPRLSLRKRSLLLNPWTIFEKILKSTEIKPNGDPLLKF